METFEEQARERLGEVIGGRWLLESVLGVGGMAAVYAAREPGGTIAAIKLLHAEMSVRREIRERFLREGYVANSIEHPGVVRALEHGASADDQVFLAMELLSGETLSSRVRRHGTLPLHELLDFLDQVLDVLVIAHGKGIIHRDLKPDNLWVAADGRLKILDFGLARVHESMPGDHRTRSGVALGTLPYMAPEQALGRRAEIDGRVDIFALGATAFRILSGRKVHEAESEAELLIAMASRPAPPLQQIVPRLPSDVCMVIDLALAFQRDARYPDAKTMQDDVRALRNGQRPGYALARLSALGDATRVDHAAPAAAPPSSSFGSSYGAGPASMPGSSHGAGPASMPGSSYGAAPAASLESAKSSSFPIVALLLGAFFFLIGVGGVVAYFVVNRSSDTAGELAAPNSNAAGALPAAVPATTADAAAGSGAEPARGPGAAAAQVPRAASKGQSGATPSAAPASGEPAQDKAKLVETPAAPAPQPAGAAPAPASPAPAPAAPAAAPIGAPAPPAAQPPPPADARDKGSSRKNRGRREK